MTAQKIEEGKKASAPSTPTKGTDTFDGWYYNNGVADVLWDFTNNTVTSNVTLTAHWSAASAAINYTNLYGTSVSALPTEYTIGTGIASFADPVGTRTGYTFAGWSPSSISSSETAAQTIAATWSPVTYSITYSGVKDGSTHSNPATYNIESAQIDLSAASDVTGTWGFEGWYSDALLTEKITSIPTGSHGDRTIYANYTDLSKVYHTVTLNYANGDANGSVQVEEGQTVAQPANPEKAGHTFSEWQLAGATYNFSVPVMDDITLTAVYTINHYTVTFLNKDNTTFATQENVTWNTTISAPEGAPEATGFTFNGWDYNFSTPITNNISISANWDAEQYTVTFEPNGGSAVASRTIDYSEAVGALPEPTRAGFELQGWFTEPYGGTEITAAQSITASVTYYAHWNAVKQELFYYQAALTENVANNSTLTAVGGTFTTRNGKAGDSGQVTAQAPGSGGFTYAAGTPDDMKVASGKNSLKFNGSNVYLRLNLNNSGKVQTGDTIRINGYGPIDIYNGVTWGASSMTLGNKIVSTGSFGSGNRNYAIATVVVPQVANENVAFDSLCLVRNSNGYIAAMKIIRPAQGKLTVTYDLNGAAGDAPAAVELYKGDKLFTLPANPVRAGFSFGGWFDNAEGTGTAVDPADAITESMTIYAKWTSAEYSVTLAKGTNGVTDGAATVHYGDAALTISADPVGPSVAAAGGYYDGENKIAEADGTLVAGTAYTDAEGKWNVTSGATLTAQWVTSFGVTYVMNGGEAISATSYEAADGLTLPTSATRTNYVFNGWKNENGATATAIAPNTTGAKTFYACWTAQITSVDAINDNANQNVPYSAATSVTGHFGTNGTIDVPVAWVDLSTATPGANVFDGTLTAPTGDTYTTYTLATGLKGTLNLNVRKEVVHNDGYIYAYNDADHYVDGVYKKFDIAPVSTSGDDVILYDSPVLNVSTYKGLCDAKSGDIAHITSYIKLNKAEGMMTVAVADGYSGTLTIKAGGYNKECTVTVNGTSQNTTDSDIDHADGFCTLVYDLVEGDNELSVAGNNNLYISHINVAVSMTEYVDYVAVSSVTLNKDASALRVGESEQLTATIAPNTATEQTVTWASSAEAVATVDADGTVHAVAIGTATITASADGKSATCTVTVSAHPAVIYTLSAIGETKIDVNETTAPLQLSGSEAAYTYQLYNGENAVGAAVQGTGEALTWNAAALGTYTVRVVNGPLMTGSVAVTAAVKKELVQVLFSNGFDAFIKNNTVYAYYMEGEAAPTMTSYTAATPANVTDVAMVDGKLRVTGSDATIKEYALVLEPVAPYTTVNEDVTFDGTEGYAKTGYSLNEYGWRFSRMSKSNSAPTGENRLYFFFGPALKATFTTGYKRNAKIYVNGTETNIAMASNNETFDVPLSLEHNNVVLFTQNSDNGDAAVKAVRLKGWEVFDATRTNAAGRFGTFCYEKSVSENMYRGATFYRVAERYGVGVVLEEVTELQAGMPYLFVADAPTIHVVWNDDDIFDPILENGCKYGVGGSNGSNGLVGNLGGNLTGNYGNEYMPVPAYADCYLIDNNHLWLCGENCTINKHRVYLDMNHVGDEPVQAVPGRRRMILSQHGVATGLDNLSDDSIIDMSGSKKIVLDGVMYIIRDGRLFDTTGRALK